MVTATGVKVVLKRSKDTKGTVVFKSDEPKASAIDSQYVNKGFGFDDAEEIEITIERKK